MLSIECETQMLAAEVAIHTCEARECLTGDFTLWSELE